jgi:hypothetical protein
MPVQTTTDCFLFPELFSRPVVASFDQDLASSDGGAVLLKAADRRVGLTGAMSEVLWERRQPGKVKHLLDELLSQRIYSIACGYPDANDAARLGDDPIHKMLIGRDPADGTPLASQPTLSRFENTVSRTDLLRLGYVLLEQVLTRHRRRLGRRRVRRITLDLDVSHDPTHGGQQLSFFHGHYDTYCYLPLFGFLTFNEEAEQYLCAALLRPGNVPDKHGTVPLLERLLPAIRKEFPKARILVRLDGGFRAAEILNFLDEQPKVDFVVGYATNEVLEPVTFESLCASWAAWRDGETGSKSYGECLYKAGTWKRARRVIFKTEIVSHPGRDLKENVRFVVTNLPQSPKWIYERIYCLRGDVENRIKELKDDLQIDRTSCSRFLANQMRVMLTAAAYVLMQELRLHLARTRAPRCRTFIIRDHLLKIGARVVASVRRVVLHLPRSYPFLDLWAHLAQRLGAQCS